jgi:hypothetical protein
VVLIVKPFQMKKQKKEKRKGEKKISKKN